MRTGSSFRQALFFIEVGFMLHDTIIYNKGTRGYTHPNSRYDNIYEFIFILSRVSLKPLMIKDTK